MLRGIPQDGTPNVWQDILRDASLVQTSVQTLLQRMLHRVMPPCCEAIANHAANLIFFLLFRVALLVSSDDRMNFPCSLCCRASLAEFVCFCALAPRGAS
jgi:hypothetical protein